jgi:hypothetical protein
LPGAELPQANNRACSRPAIHPREIYHFISDDLSACKPLNSENNYFKGRIFNLFCGLILAGIGLVIKFAEYPDLGRILSFSFRTFFSKYAGPVRKTMAGVRKLSEKICRPCDKRFALSEMRHPAGS